MTGIVRKSSLLLAPLAALAFLGQGAWGQPVGEEWYEVDRGEGPYERLIIRGAYVVDGSGAPPSGPSDIVIEGDEIVEVRTVGYPHVPIDPDDRPGGATREIDAHGHYVLPGFIDLHAHAGARGDESGVPDDLWSYKLWLAHGITTVRGVALGPNLDWGIEQRELSVRNEIPAPRIFECAKVPADEEDFEHNELETPEQGREWVRYAAERGADCLKLGSYAAWMMHPPVMEAILEEAQAHGLGTTAHLHQVGVAEMDALDMARAGLDGMTHFYGLFESMYADDDVQPFPVDYNYQDEQHRFGEVARQWDLIHEPGSEEWDALLEEFLEQDFFLNPTMTIYEASRELDLQRYAPWHDRYTLPTHWEFFRPARDDHGSYWFYWTTEDEVAWKNYFDRWMEFLDDYKNRGGRVTTGSDSCCIYKLHGFGYIRELELLQEAGFNPHEVIRSATYHAAQELFEPQGEPIEFGLVRPGMKADLVIVDENPLENLKVLYGTGAVKLDDDTGDVARVGGVDYTVKDGIVFDAEQLLEDVAEMVRQEKMEVGMEADERLPRY